jgi:exodeoxyribonuclease III
MGVRIATWNVNSIRSRVDRVEAWLERSDCDVLAIQETKANQAQFPLLGLSALGYEVAHHGLNQWNGVAILSRVGLGDVEVGFPDMPPLTTGRSRRRVLSVPPAAASGSGRCTCPTAVHWATRTSPTSWTGSSA